MSVPTGELIERLLQCCAPANGFQLPICRRCKSMCLPKPRPVCLGPFSAAERMTILLLLTPPGEPSEPCSGCGEPTTWVLEPHGRVLLHRTPLCEHFVRTQSRPGSGLLTTDFAGFLPASEDPRRVRP